MDWLPYTQCTIGGENCELVPFLTHLVLWSTERRLSCVEFYYGNSDKDIPTMRLGIPPGEENEQAQRQVFEIDSTRGERLKSIEIIFEPPSPESDIKEMRAVIVSPFSASLRSSL